MEKKDTIFTYIGEALIIFAISIIFISISNVVFGGEAREISSLYSVGSQVISIKTVMQFLLFSGTIEVIKFLWFMDRTNKVLGDIFCVVGMLVSVVVSVAIYSYLFQWFPILQVEAWISFFICFAIFFVITLFLMTIKSKLENKKLEESIKKYQQEHGVEDKE